MSEHLPSQYSENPGMPGQALKGIADLQDTFRFHTEPHQLEKITNLLESPQFALLNPKQQTEQREVLSEGMLEGRPVEYTDVMRGSQDEIEERLFIARVLIKAPETAHALVEAGVAGFHATDSYGLAGIIESGGMFSASALHEQGKVSKGEGDAAVDGKGQKSISFGLKHRLDVNIGAWGGRDETISDSEVRERLQQTISDIQLALDEMPEGTRGQRLMQAAMHNATLLKKNYEEDPNSLTSTMLRHKFPVAIGVSADFVQDAEASRESGHLLIGERYFGEFRPNAQAIPLESLPIIGVPRDKVEATNALLAMFGRKGVRVVALEDLTV